jgi:hypothetical protein
MEIIGKSSLHNDVRAIPAPGVMNVLMFLAHRNAGDPQMLANKNYEEESPGTT